MFGATTTQPQTGTNLFGGGGGGLFGATNQQQQQQSGAQPQQQNTFGNLFGQTKPAAAPQAGGGLFGGGFGTTQPAQTQPAAGGGLFGGSTLGQQPQAQQATNAFGGGGLFGGVKPAPTLGTSTSTGMQQPGMGNSLFGGSTLGQSTATMGASMLGQSQAPLTASIAQPIASNLPIFNMLPPGPRAVTLDQQPKKKSGYFVDVPTRAPVPQLNLRYAPATTKLRGFGSTSTLPSSGSSQLGGGSLLYTSGKPNALSLTRTSSSKSLLSPDSFLTNGRASPTLGSGGRQSVKKLTLDRKVEPSDLFSKSNANLNVGGGNGGPSFNAKLSIAARESEAAAAPRGESPSPAVRAQKNQNHSRFAASEPEVAQKDPTELQEGDYWVKPSLGELKALGHDELMAFEGLVVGRVGYGQITFLEAVDLTGLPRLSSLLGEVVRFDDKECSVYPDADDAEKPPAGAGLNVRARIELVRCCALDKATREPIRDAAHPSAVRHLKRLKGMKHTAFEGFDIEEGKWTFTVEHF